MHNPVLCRKNALGFAMQTRGRILLCGMLYTTASRCYFFHISPDFTEQISPSQENQTSIAVGLYTIV